MGAGRTLALIGIILVAINLRTAVAAVSPIASEIRADFPMSRAMLGLIGALPPIANLSFPDRIGTISGAYAFTIAISSSVPAVVTVPVADVAGWRVSLGLWSLLAVTALGPIVVGVLHDVTGGWTVPLILAIVSATLCLVPATMPKRADFVEDQIKRVRAS